MEKTAILYLFGGEKAQGAEIVIERLMAYNLDNVSPHLFISPGNFASKLIAANKPYAITLVPNLKKLNRSKTGSLNFYWRAIKNYFAISYQVGQYIKKHHIGIVHANTVVPSSYIIPLILYSRLTNKKTKWLWSDHDLLYYSKLDNILAKICARLYNATLVVSGAVKVKYKTNEKVKVLYNGLDVEYFKPDNDARKIIRDKLNLEDEVIAIGMPAVVTPRKGQLGLIEVFNKLSATNPHIRLLLAGGYEEATPEYSKAVQTEISSNKKIIHMGYMELMTDFYNACDIIVNNSDINGSEPLGTTIYEGMACEKILIAADTGGSKEIIDNNINGLLFEPESLPALEEKLRFVLSGQAPLSKMANMARIKAENRFNIVSTVQRYNQIIVAIWGKGVQGLQ